MKKHLSLALCACFGGGIFAQSFYSYYTDPNGKIYTESSLNVNQTYNFLNPMWMDLDWPEDDFNLSNSPSVDSWDVRLEVDSGGTPYVVYSDNLNTGLQKILFRKKVEGNWTEPFFVDAGGEIGGRNTHFGALAISPNGDLHVVYNVWAFENVRNYVGYSHYNASTDTWEPAVKISDLNGTVNHFNTRYDLYSTPDNNPVVVWGFDYRANESNEEIYMKYFDGTNWSADLPVSDVEDNTNAGYPYMKRIADNYAMIVYSEGTELRYRLYDETTHELSEPKVIVSENVGVSNYVLTTFDNNVRVLLLYKDNALVKDVMKVYNYAWDSDQFIESSNVFQIDANAGGLMKTVDFDCMANGECGIVFTEFLEKTLSYLPYNDEEGFGDIVVINNEDPEFDKPTIRFDGNGNAHVVWCDNRFDDGGGWLKREVLYKMGANPNAGVEELIASDLTIYPNPSNGTIHIDTKESYRMEIYTLAGQLIKFQNIDGKTSLNTQLPKGVYILKFSNQKQTHTKKLLIK